MNPFCLPEKIFISSLPTDMRSGIESLSHKVTLTFGLDAYDGSLYGFISSDAKKMKLIRYVEGVWCLYYLKLQDHTIRWPSSYSPYLVEVDVRELIRLIKGSAILIQKERLPSAKRCVL